MEKLKVELSVQEWNVVLQALARLPFGDVAGLIFKLKAQLELLIKKDEADG